MPQTDGQTDAVCSILAPARHCPLFCVPLSRVSLGPLSLACQPWITCQPGVPLGRGWQSVSRCSPLLRLRSQCSPCGASPPACPLWGCPCSTASMPEPSMAGDRVPGRNQRLSGPEPAPPGPEPASLRSEPAPLWAGTSTTKTRIRRTRTRTSTVGAEHCFMGSSW